MSWLGIHAMASLNAGADNMSAAAQRALEAARANQSVIALNRAEFRVALDPSPENRSAVHSVIDEQMKLFNERLTDLRKTRDEQAMSMLPAVKEAMADYQRDLQNTLSLADSAKNVQLGDCDDSIARLRNEEPRRRGETAGQCPGGCRSTG